MPNPTADHLLHEHILIRQGKLFRNGVLSAEYTPPDLADLYQKLSFSYPKFFKMDGLCKLAWIAAEALLMGGEACLYDETDKSRIAVVLSTTDGCLDVDKRYSETITDIPSPALFVYTLPNIMLGEISIRHGFKGEQLCLLSDEFDAEEMLFQVNDLLQNRGITHCLFGKIDATGLKQEAVLFWVNADSIKLLSVERIQNLMNGSIHE